MRIPGSSFLGSVKHKFRKDTAAEDPQNGEVASPRLPASREPGTNPETSPGPGQVPEPIALATLSPSIDPGGINENVSPFIDSEDSRPGQPDPIQPDPIADGPGPSAGPSDPTEIPAQPGPELEAATSAPVPPWVADQGAVEGPIGDSSPPADTGKFDLQAVFVKKSVGNPTIKALLERHPSVNTRALGQELKEFARQLGLSPPNE